MEISAAIIARNEEKSIRGLLDSLKGVDDIVVLSTGSTDRTVEIAKEYGCNVIEVGDKFKRVATQEEYDRFKEKFGFEPSFEVGKGYFHFSDARNYAVSFTKHSHVFQPDCDEVVEWDLEKVKKEIEECDQLVYRFCYQHNEDGTCALEFTHCKFFDKTKVKWVGWVHELPVTIDGGSRHEKFTDSIYHHHYQLPKEERGNYLPGLELSVLQGDKELYDRNIYYYARELFYNGKWEQAIKTFDIAFEVMTWTPEISQAYIFLSQCHRELGDKESQKKCLLRAIELCQTRREPYFELAQAYEQEGDTQTALAFYLAASAIEFRPHGYINEKNLYGWVVPERISAMYGRLGNFEESKRWFLETLKHNPPDYVVNSAPIFFGELPKITIIVPHLPSPERNEGLKKLEESIERLSYPKDKIETLVIVDEPRKGVPERVHEGYLNSTGEYIVFAATDTVMVPNSLIVAYIEMVEKGKRFLAFNTGEVGWDNGNECEHFMIKKDLVPEIGGEIFCRRFNHCCCDTLLKAKVKKLHEFYRSKNAVMIHNHYSKTGKYDSVYELGWSKVDEDRKILVEELKKIDAYSEMAFVPKKIFTVWVGEEMPENIKKCIKSQKIEGYEHKVIGNDDIPDIPYVKEAIKEKKWVKAADYLRIYFLEKEGGIYLDADMEILEGKNFDHIIHNAFFVGREDNGFIANSIIGSIEHHPILKKTMEEMERNFKGNDDLVFESGMELFTSVVSSFNSGNIKIFPSEFFFPFNHQTGVTNVTENSVTFHHFNKSWK